MHKEAFLDKPWEGTVLITISAKVEAAFLGHFFQWVFDLIKYIFILNSPFFFFADKKIDI